MRTRSIILININTICTALIIIATVAVLGTAVQPTQAQCETFKLLASDGAAQDYFGRSVAISGTTAIVGAYWDDDNGTWSGSAYLFDTTSGQQLFKLLPSDGNEWDYFGYTVAISGTTAIAGAYGNDDNGNASGSAYLFDTTTGQQLFKLLPSDGNEWDYFGYTVAINGSTAIVGAYGDDDNGTDSGSAYLFDTATGQQLFKLLPSDGAAYDYFGYTLAIGGTTAIIGAYRDDDNGSGSGSAYLFDTTTGQQLFKLLPSDGAVGDEFGISVAISGTTAISGAHRDNDSGTAYLFDTTTGQQLFKLLPSDGAAVDYFGISVAISGTTAIIGANGDDDNGLDSGSAYLFNTTTGQQFFKLLPSDGAAYDEFGRSVAISGTTTIVGAYLDDDYGNYSGSAYLFDLDLNCSPQLNIEPYPLLAGQDGAFTSVNMNPNTNSYLAYSLRSTGNTYVPFLNITLDLKQPVQAGKTITSDSNGTAEWILHIPNAGAGRNVWFQACQYELKTNVVATRIE